MTVAENVWSFGMLGALVVALQIFMRIRRRTKSHSDASLFKSQLPGWVLLMEKFVLYCLVLATGVVLCLAFNAVHRHFSPGRPVSGATAIFATLGAGLVGLPIAALSANGISWMVPALRSANLHAMSGVPVSFGQMNKGLMLFGAVSVPVGLIWLVLAVVEPWAH